LLFVPRLGGRTPGSRPRCARCRTPPGSNLRGRRSRPDGRGSQRQCQREAETPCVPPCSASSLIQAVSSTVQSHRPPTKKKRSRAATPKLSSGAGQPTITLRTFLDGTERRGRHFRIERCLRRARGPRKPHPRRGQSTAPGVSPSLHRIRW